MNALELVAHVRRHARRRVNEEPWWIVVEQWKDDEMVRELREGGIATADDAIAVFKMHALMQFDRR